MVCNIAASATPQPPSRIFSRGTALCHVTPETSVTRSKHNLFIYLFIKFYCKNALLITTYAYLHCYDSIHDRTVMMPHCLLFVKGVFKKINLCSRDFW